MLLYNAFHRQSFDGADLSSSCFDACEETVTGFTFSCVSDTFRPFDCQPQRVAERFGVCVFQNVALSFVWFQEAKIKHTAQHVRIIFVACGSLCFSGLESHLHLSLVPALCSHAICLSCLPSGVRSSMQRCPIHRLSHAFCCKSRRSGR